METNVQSGIFRNNSEIMVIYVNILGGKAYEL